MQDFTCSPPPSAFNFTAVGTLANGNTYTLLTSINPVTNAGAYTISGQTLGGWSSPHHQRQRSTVTTSLNEGIWNQAGGGNWSDGNPGAAAGDWTNYKPTVSGDAALFGSAIAPRIRRSRWIRLHSVGFMRFDNALYDYTIGSNGSNNLTLNNGINSAALRRRDQHHPTRSLRTSPWSATCRPSPRQAPA